MKDVKRINIELANTNIEIIRGSEFKVGSNNKNISFKNENGVLEIKDEKTKSEYKFKFIFKCKINAKLKNEHFVRIFVPDILLEEVYIKSAAGGINVQDVSSDKFIIESGAGNLCLNNVNVENSFKISAGVGKSIINNSKFNNAKLGLGVGKFNFNGTLKGETDISVGVGSVELALDDINNHKIYVNKGIGSIKISGNGVSNGVYGNGSEIIHIDGGIGSLNIK